MIQADVKTHQPRFPSTHLLGLFALLLTCVIWRSFREELIIVYGAQTMGFQEGVEKGETHFGYSAARSRGSSVTDCLSRFYLEGERIKAKLMSLIKKQLSLLLISREAVIFVVAEYPLFCCVLDIIME